MKAAGTKRIYAASRRKGTICEPWLPEPLPVSRNEVLLRIFFYDYLDEDTRQARLTEYENKLEFEMRRLQAVQEIAAEELEHIEHPENYYYVRRVRAHLWIALFRNGEKVDASH